MATVATDADFVARITAVAQMAKMSGFEDVAAWMQARLGEHIRESRPQRRRGVDVTLGRINRRVRLDAARVRDLMKDGE